MKDINFKLDGLTCEACVKLASKRLRSVPGVLDVNINLVSGETHVSSETVIDLESLTECLAGTTYKIVK